MTDVMGCRLSWSDQVFPPGKDGVRGVLSSGKGTVADYAQAAQAAGLQFLVFLEDSLKRDEARWQQLVDACAAASDASFAAIPGLTYEDAQGRRAISTEFWNRNLVMEEFFWCDRCNFLGNCRLRTRDGRQVWTQGSFQGNMGITPSKGRLRLGAEPAVCLALDSPTLPIDGHPYEQPQHGWGNSWGSWHKLVPTRLLTGWSRIHACNWLPEEFRIGWFETNVTLKDRVVLPDGGLEVMHASLPGWVLRRGEDVLAAPDAASAEGAFTRGTFATSPPSPLPTCGEGAGGEVGRLRPPHRPR